MGTSTGVSGSSGSSLFNGTSRFSSDFQNLITRAVAIANLPVTQLTRESSAFVGQSTELGTLGSKFANIQSAIQQLQTAVSSGSLSGSVSDTSIAQVQVAKGAHAGSYTLEVNTLGSYTNTLSDAGATPITDPSTQNISSSSTFTLTVNGTATTVTPAGGTLDDLVASINSTGGLNVQASIVNVGSSASPDYRLSLQSSELGPDDIQLNDGTTDLLSNISTGTLASYQIDGLQTPTTSTSRTINLSPGVTVTLSGESPVGSPVVIGVNSDTSSVQNALSQFVYSFNSAASEIANNQGSAGGALQGQSIVYQLGRALQNLGSYSSGSSGLSSLTDLGITFDKTGHLSLDSSVFASATSGQLQALTSFLGDSASGGFLQFASNALSSVTDATTGTIAAATASVQTQTVNINNLIAVQQDRVNTLQTNLQNQLAASDALVANLEQTYNLIAGIFQAQQYNSSTLSK